MITIKNITTHIIILRHAFVCLFITFSLTSGFSQYTKTATCQDASFDHKVDQYLTYSVPVIGVQEAYKKKSEFLFLDARELEEYQVSHIPESRFVGFDHFDSNTLKDVPKNKKIIVYCSIGYRSEKVATKLKEKGYKEVYNLYGSLFEWANQSYPLTDQNGKLTKNVHTYNKDWSQWLLNPAMNKKW